MDNLYHPNKSNPDSWTDEEVEEEGRKLVEYMSIDNHMWMRRFAADRGYNSRVWDNWMKQRKGNFQYYYDIAREIQESKLVEKPFYRKADGQQARFILSCAHGSEWVPQQKVQMAQEIKWEGVSYGDKPFEQFDTKTLKTEEEYSSDA